MAVTIQRQLTHTLVHETASAPRADRAGLANRASIDGEATPLGQVLSLVVAPPKALKLPTGRQVVILLSVTLSVRAPVSPSSAAV